MPAWSQAEGSESEVEKLAPDLFLSNEEPRRGLEPLKIGLIEDRFEDLSGKTLVKGREDYSAIPFSCRRRRMLAKG